MPEISQLPALSKLFDVSIDFLMTGKIDEMISLDDMDSVKRMFYLIKNDDAILRLHILMILIARIPQLLV